MYKSKLISCDFSTKNTGYCIFGNGSLVAYDSFSSVRKGGKEPPQTIFDSFYQQFTVIMDEHRPELMAHEQPFFRNFKTSHVLIGILCIAELVCEQYDCQVIGGVAVTSLKLWATGYGKATKEDMIERTAQWLDDLTLGPRATARTAEMNDDEADALMVGLKALQERGELASYLIHRQSK